MKTNTIKEYSETKKRVEWTAKDLEESRRALLNILEDTETAKREIESEKGRTQIILNNFIDGLLIFNPKGELRLINSKAEEFLGVNQEEAIGFSMAELEKKPHARQLVRIIRERTGEIFRKELKLQDKQMVVEVTIQPIASFDYKAKDTLVTLHDITRDKVIEQLKSQFVSVAAHQLRTPLSIIKWSLSMLLEEELGTLTPEQKEILLKTNQTNERMIRLINDLLNVARIEEGRFMYHPKTVDFTELVQSVIEPLRVLAKEKKVKLKIDLSADKKAKVVKADIEKLSLAMKNLIENAIFYTGQHGQVTILLKRKNNELEFSIQDTGIGIPKAQQERVFTKFFRGDNAVRMETEGTGLGLFIAKNIIEAHKGKIWFISKENKGTTFFVSLPTIG